MLLGVVESLDRVLTLNKVCVALTELRISCLPIRVKAMSDLKKALLIDKFQKDHPAPKALNPEHGRHTDTMLCEAE